MTHSSDLSPAVWLFMALYLGVGGGLFVYGVHAYVMSWLFRRHERSASDMPAGVDKSSHPMVTVQLPIYNEFYVVERLVDAVAAFEWPRDRLEIQVLDDSSDDTVSRVAAIVARLRGDGFRIEQVRRDARTGYKGGALREGMARATGDFVAVFDADFLPPPNFLTATIPHFADSRVGMVQARWGHLNEDYSLLTRAQAVALDGHFLIEQTARNRSGAFINFNGTAGIWRRATILDAGNWQDDTLTEDLDLSYRAQMKGWRFVFLPGLVCPAELPVDIDGFKGQQFRWAKGSVQTAMKLLPGLVRSRVGLFVKLQAAIHLTNHAVYPLLLLLALFSLPAVILHQHEPMVRRFFVVATFFVIASLGHPLLYLDAQRRLKPDWPRQLALMPVLIALGMGIAVNNVRAVVEALAGIRSGFNRTPKYDLRRSGDDWRAKRYRVPVNAWPLLELALGAWTGAALIYSIRHGQWLATPFLVLYCAGFLSVGGASIARALEVPGGVARTA